MSADEGSRARVDLRDASTDFAEGYRAGREAGRAEVTLWGDAITLVVVCILAAGWVGLMVVLL